MPRYWRLLLLILSVMWVSSANATLIELDDPVFGPASITRDTDTGLDWLDVPITVGRSYNDVESQFGPSGDFAGFRHATKYEVQALMNGVGFTYYSCCPPIPENYQPAVYLQGLVGETDATGTGYDGYALTLSVTGTREIEPYYWGTAIYRSDEYQTASAEDYEVRMAEDAVGSFGHWLVRPVPEPSTSVLLLAGLIGFARRRRVRA